MFEMVRKFDWPLMAAFFVLFACSLLVLSSIAYELFWSQLMWISLFLCGVLIMASINWRTLINYPWIVWGFYVIAVVLLLITVIWGRTIRGTASWITIGSPESGIRFQPAELAKVALIILYAQYFARRHVSVASLRTIALSFLYFVLPAFIILKQPDLGSASILFGIWFGFLLVSGLPLRRIIASIVIFGVIALIAWQFLLKPYQKNRIIGFISPSYDPLGINYNVTQSKIAIGSAGWWGKGYGQGTQSHLGFLPEAHTDFIFAAFTEEWGFIGALFLIGVLGFVILRIIKIGILCEDNFGRFVSLGTALMILIQSFLNLGFNLGILPVVGIPLPFLSYGGSHLLTTGLLVGIIQNIAIRLK